MSEIKRWDTVDIVDLFQRFKKVPERLVDEADYDAVVQERDTLARRVAWQPIETAPKDGTAILLWAKDLRFPGEQCVAAWERVDIEWWHVTDGKFGPWPLRGPSPTHWMPLPAPPVRD